MENFDTHIVAQQEWIKEKKLDELLLKYFKNNMNIRPIQLN
jgi:hypothetical protein